MPTEKDGVVLHLGSQQNFSQQLLMLDRETSPLRVLPSCPRNFKRTSVERYFREKGFAIDWCAFRLLELDQDSSSEDTTAIYRELTSESSKEETSTQVPLKKMDQFSEHLKSFESVHLPQRSKLPLRDISSEFLFTAIPVGIVFIITAIVLLALLCIKKKDEPEEEWQAFTESLFLVVKVIFKI